MPTGSTSFTDASGRVFNCVLNTAAVAEMQRDFKIDIASILDGKADIDDRMSGGATLVGLLWIASRESAEKLGVTPEQFGAALGGGDVLDDAVDAFLMAIVNFSPRSRRPAIEALIAKGAEVQTEMMKQVVRKIHKVDPKAAMTQAMPELYDETSQPPNSATSLAE